MISWHLSANESRSRRNWLFHGMVRALLIDEMARFGHSGHDVPGWEHFAELVAVLQASMRGFQVLMRSNVSDRAAINRCLTFA